MALDILRETFAEARRLLEAGAALAPGDFRVQKLLPGLREAGAQAAVLGRVADALERATAPSSGPEASGEAADALMEAYALSEAVLATQAGYGAPGELVRFSGTLAGSPNAAVPYSALAPAIAALAESGQWRASILREAMRSGAAYDARLAPALARGLGDGYAEVADLAAECLLKTGPVAGPVVRALFDPAGGAGQPRRLALLHKLGLAPVAELRAIAAESPAPDLRVVAIKALAPEAAADPAVRELLLGLCLERRKDIRGAACAALAGLDSEDVAEALAAALGKGVDPAEIEEIADRAAALPASSRPARAFLKLAEDALGALLASKAGLDEAAVKELSENFAAGLRLVRGRGDEGALAFYGRALAESALLQKKAKGRWTFLEPLLTSMYSGRNGGALALLLEWSLKAGEEYAGYGFIASSLFEDPRTVYDRFAPLLLKKGKASAKILDAWQLPARLSEGKFGFDVRWFDAFIKIDQPRPICSTLAPSMPESAWRYLEKKANSPSANADDLPYVLTALAAGGRRDAPALIAKALRDAKRGEPSYWPMQQAAASALRALAPGLAGELRRIAEKEKDDVAKAALMQGVIDMENRTR